MSSSRRSMVALATLAALAIAGPVSSAGASAAGIKHAIKSFEGRILTAEGHVVSAEGAYTTSKDPAPVVAALEGAEKVLGQLRTAVEHQSAGRPKVKEAKRLVIAGLTGVISAYDKLKTAFSEKAVNETAAKAEAEKAVVAAKAAKRDLRKAGLLLG